MVRIGARKSLKIVESELVSIGCLDGQQRIPLLVKPTIKELGLLAWGKQNRVKIEEFLLQHGAILFRGFQIDGVKEFEEFIKAIAGDLLKYDYASTPRTKVSGKIYTSTEYPADKFIPLHNEMSYAKSYPEKIAFYCVKQAESGGETPIADSAKVCDRIPSEIKSKFQEKGVMYVRNYREGIDLSWQNVFNTNDKSEVEYYCNQNQIEWEWKGENWLRTAQVCPAIAIHPQTGKEVWFNQAHLFHASQLEPTVRQQLLLNFSEDLPRNAYYGDGSVIEDFVLAEIRQIYQEETVEFSWQERDVLLLDNLLVAHGRNPFTGSRKVVVGMS